MKQWEKDFDKLFVEQGSHRGGKVVRQEAGKIIDFIRETREQAKKEERERIAKLLNKALNKYSKTISNGGLDYVKAFLYDGEIDFVGQGQYHTHVHLSQQ